MKAKSVSFKVVIVGLAAILSILFTPGPASASGTSCSYGNPLYGPSYYCETVSGSGTYVSSVSGSFRGSAVICNYSITAEFFSYGWSWYQTLYSGTRWGCANGDNLYIPVYNYKWPGYVCSTLSYYDGLGRYRTMSACNEIHS